MDILRYSLHASTVTRRFVDLLYIFQWDLYDTLDWDESWDEEDREAEDRWFGDDE